MGLRSSKLNNKIVPSSINDPYKHVNMIAASLITKSRFKDKLLSRAHCDELIIITEAIFRKYFTIDQIHYINREISDKPIDKNVYVLDTNSIRKLDERNPDIKKAMCKSVASFYIKIAHMFSAVFCTLNPELDNLKSTIKQDKKKYSLSRTSPNFCTKRIINMQKANTHIDAPASQTICQPLEHGNNTIKHKYLEEFVKLYPEPTTLDEPNIEKQGANQFKKRMTDCKKQGKPLTYNEGEKAITDTNFESIRFKDYCSKIKCDRLDKLNLCFRKEQKTLDTEYKNHLMLTEKRYLKNRSILLGYIDKLFTREKTEYVIRSSLNYKIIDEMMTSLRKAIAKCYFDCEEDYQKGLLLYEAKLELSKLTSKCNKEFRPAAATSQDIKRDIDKIKEDKLHLKQDNQKYESDARLEHPKYDSLEDSYNLRDFELHDSLGYKTPVYDYRRYNTRGYNTRGYNTRGYDTRGYNQRKYDTRKYDTRELYHKYRNYPY